jgi:thymidylate synthase (FAD)
VPATDLRLELLAHTPEPLALIFAAFRQCYSPGEAADLWPRLRDGRIPRREQADFVRRILESGHTSPVEHVSFTFAASGVSRALTHQLVRHRIASYSQQSQRYVDASRFAYVLPPSIAGNPEASAVFTRFMDESAAAYRQLTALLGGGGAREDARFVLPQAAASSIVLTMNCRSLLNFFENRCCLRAQWEIRRLARSMLTLCADVLPEIFAVAGARCERLGYCPEGDFSCGRYPPPGNARSAPAPEKPVPKKSTPDEDGAAGSGEFPIDSR